ncbi:MAG: hypothetical protein KatS3mg088_146 [Patescibacteria group bacterium]|nr:MAG: hypothetical protein KatS3mg088_146 [Patescibacteria group bacterium]
MNPDKVKIVQNSFKEIHLEVEIVRVEAGSGITDQPLDKETTLKGAINRAKSAREIEPRSDFWLGLEEGLQDYEGLYNLVTFACLIDKTGENFIGEGQEIPLPKKVSDEIRKGGWFGEVIRKFSKSYKIDKNLITRFTPFTQAIQNAYALFLKKYGNLGYRNKVSGIIMDKNGKLLIVQLTTYGKDQWNFPGGGIEDDEEEEEAILRELREELGTSKFEIISKSDSSTKYDWPPFVIVKWLKEEGKTWVGQKVGYYLIRFTGQRSDIKPDPREIRKVKWVKEGDLKDYFVFPNQLEQAKMILKEFRI